MSKWGRLWIALSTIVALLVPATAMIEPASATAAGPTWSGTTYTGKSADHGVPKSGSVNPDTNLNRISQAVLVSADFSPGNPAATTNVTIKECKSDGVTGCSTLTTLNITSALQLSTTVNVTDCGDAAGCTVFSYLTHDTDDTMTVPIKFAPPAQTTTTLQLSATGFTSGANLTVPYGTSLHAQATVTTPGFFALVGSVQYSLFSDSTCTTPSGAGTTVAESSDTGVDAPSANFLVPAPGTYFWKAAYLNNDANNLPSSTSCGDNVLTVTPPLFTSVSALPAAPDSVTAGNDVQYTLSVQNQGPTTATAVHVLATLDSGVTPLSSTAGACTLTTPVADCTLGTIGAGATASVNLLVKSPSPAPASGKITLSATATPGTNNTASVDTAVVAPVPGTASGFVPPGNSIDTGGNNPTDLSLPNTGGGAPVMITQSNGAQFCNGPCTGPASLINNFSGYLDPTKPIHLVLKFTDPNLGSALKDFATSTVYKHFDNDPATVGHVVPDCLDNPAWTPAQKAAARLRRRLRVGTHSGIANPAPCVDARTITPLTQNLISGPYQVTFTILYLSDDGTYSRH
jgi:uncharacterized repeat protein (TIGR01451 family)